MTSIWSIGELYTNIITEIVKRKYIYKHIQIWYKYNGLHAFAKGIVFDKVYKIYNILCATSESVLR